MNTLLPPDQLVTFLTCKDIHADKKLELIEEQRALAHRYIKALDALALQLNIDLMENTND